MVVVDHLERHRVQVVHKVFIVANNYHWPNASHSARTVCPLTSRHKHSCRKNPCVATNSPPSWTRWGRNSVCRQGFATQATTGLKAGRPFSYVVIESSLRRVSPMSSRP